MDVMFTLHKTITIKLILKLYIFSRSPSPFNVYPKIFTKIQQQHHQQLQDQKRQLSPYKRSTSHSTSWGKRSTSHSTSWGKRSSSTGIRRKFISIGTSPWNLIKWGLKRNAPHQQSFDNRDFEENVAKRIWLPDGFDDDDFEDNIDDNEVEDDVSDDVVKKYIRIRGKIIEH